MRIFLEAEKVFRKSEDFDLASSRVFRALKGFRTKKRL